MASEQFDDAVITARRALAVYITVQGRDGKSIPIMQQFLGAALLSLGRRQSDQQNFIEAEKSLREGIQLSDPPLPGWENVFAISLAILGKIYETGGRYADAEAYDLRALEYRSKSADPADPLLLQILAALAAHYDQMQRPDNSAVYARRIISVLDERKQESLPLGSALIWLGRAQSKLGHYSDADATYLRALDVIDRVVPGDDPQRASVRVDIGLLRISQERYEEAETDYRAALALAEKYGYRDSSLRSSILGGLGVIYRDTARYHDAEQALSEAIKIDEAAGSTRAPLLGKRLTLLATILRREAHYSGAENLLLRSLALPLPDLDRAEALNSLGTHLLHDGAICQSRTVAH